MEYCAENHWNPGVFVDGKQVVDRDALQVIHWIGEYKIAKLTMCKT
jgi:hypothetical protein